MHQGVISITIRTILLCGGSGRRLWPLSNDIRSKVFLRVLPAEGGGRESMIQRLCRMLGQAGLLSSALIVTHHSQTEITRHHAGTEIPIVAEPHRRGTFTAVALAIRYMQACGMAEPDDTIAVLPADAYADMEFYRLLSRMPDYLAQSGAELALIGSVPDRPSTEYGYIVPQLAGGGDGMHAAGYLPAAEFAEKPDAQTAARLMERKALWNCGVFAFRLSYMLSCLAERGMPGDYEALAGQYEALPVRSFDEEVAEKARRLIVVPYDRSWRDLGDWRVLPDFLGSSVIGQGHIFDDARHTHVINELPHPIHVIGVPNLIVAASPDGILVADKAKAHLIKSQLPESSAPMYAEKRWGSYRVLDYSSDSTGAETLTKKVTLLPGRQTSHHRHQHRDETLTILTGTGEFLLEGEIRSLQAGDTVHVSRGALHGMRAVTQLEYVAVQFGTSLMQEDALKG